MVACGVLKLKVIRLNIEFHVYPIYLLLVEYLSKFGDVRSVYFNQDHKVVVTSGDQKFEPLILCPDTITFTLKLFYKI